MRSFLTAVLAFVYYISGLMPGWDEWCREASRRFTAHGYSVLCPNIYEDFGHGAPAEVAQRVRKAGGVPDGDVMADTAGALSFLKKPAGLQFSPMRTVRCIR